MDLNKIPAGRNPPYEVNVVIEVPLGGQPVKYELDKTSGAIFVDRFLHTAMTLSLAITASSPTPWRPTAIPWTSWWSARRP